MWTERDVAWSRFDKDVVDNTLVPLVKAASVVEGNSADYVQYLQRVFCENSFDDQEIEQWGREEQSHGKVLGHWAQLADPGWKYSEALVRFRELYRVPQVTDKSVRGSRAGEMVARCIVEIGTSSFYLAIADATQEPVLKEICQKIAADEFKHFGLFYRKLKQLTAVRPLCFWRRLWVAFGRITETSDDELAVAYYSANAAKGVSYDRQRCAEAYLSKTLSLYQESHIKRLVRMLMHVLGFPQWKGLQQLCYGMAYFIFWSRQRRFSRQAHRFT